VRLVLILVAMALFVLAYQWGNQYQRRAAGPPVIQGILISPAPTLPEIRLQDALGRGFGPEDLAEPWTLLAFGDLASASGQLGVQRLIDVYNRISDHRALRKHLRLVLITTTDEPNLARDFSGLLPALRIVGGTPEQIAELRAAMGLSEEDTPALFVVAPGGRVVAFLPDTLDGDTMAHDLRQIHDGADTRLPEKTP
jgi:hypothetical protein